MDGMAFLIYLLIGGFILFLIIAGAVKIAVKEALLEFKEDILQEINRNKLDNE